MEQNELGTVTLYLDNDETIECQILCVLDVNEQQYIALLPPDEEGGEESLYTSTATHRMRTENLDWNPSKMMRNTKQSVMHMMNGSILWSTRHSIWMHLD